MIELKNISKKYKDVYVLDNINLKLNDGMIYGFVGRNGSGKSVLLKIIAGYILPTSGDIIFDNKKLYKDIDIPLDTRCLIEKPEFIPYLSGYQNLKLLAEIKNIIGKDEIKETLSNVDLNNDMDKKFYKYSLGMKQKLGIAQVLMENPKVIILDEPFNGIDEQSAGKIRKLLKEEKKKGKTILIATHIKEDVDQLVDELYKVDNKNVTRV